MVLLGNGGPCRTWRMNKREGEGEESRRGGIQRGRREGRRGWRKAERKRNREERTW